MFSFSPVSLDYDTPSTIRLDLTASGTRTEFEFAANTGYMLNAVPVDSCSYGFVVAMCSTCTAMTAQGFSVVGSAQGSFTARFQEKKFTWIAQALPFVELEIADSRCAIHITAAIAGSTNYAGFQYKGGAWTPYKGSLGRSHTLYTDRSDTNVSAVFGAGGKPGQTHIRSVQLSRGGARVMVTVAQARSGRWVFSAVANGKRLDSIQKVELNRRVTVQASACMLSCGAANLPRRYVVITTPHLRITVWHREPYTPAMIRFPGYGHWLDAYLTTLRELPLPVGGVLGKTYRAGP
ncbi:hypothetical protein ACK3TF_003621 [Chlorella vulgaris]